MEMLRGTFDLIRSHCPRGSESDEPTAASTAKGKLTCVAPAAQQRASLTGAKENRCNLVGPCTRKASK